MANLKTLPLQIKKLHVQEPVAGKKLNFGKILKCQTKQYLLNTDLHGYKFIVLPKRVLLERIIWIVVVVLSLIAVIILLWMAWTNFQNSPTTTVTDSTHFPIWNYHFPAVTVCNLNKISKDKAYDAAMSLQHGSTLLTVDQLAKELRLLFQLIDPNNEKIPFKSYARLQAIFDINNVTAVDLLKNLAPNCSDVMQRCKWKGEEKMCESLFELLPTTEGYCCSFNYYALKNHSFSGIKVHTVPETPRRVSACGYQTGLEVLIDNRMSHYFATQVSSYGHRVMVHNPYEFPDWNAEFILLEVKGINFLSVAPTILYATPDVRTLSVQQRNCLFEKEKSLHNFAIYTYHNCLSECRMDVINRICGCIPFYYHNPNGTYGPKRICNLRDVECLASAKKYYINSIPGVDPDLHMNSKRFQNQVYCNCLPNCQYNYYSLEASTGAFSRKYAINQNNLYGGIKIDNQSVFRVFFNDLVGVRHRKYVYYSWHTLLALFGGLLGLFTGFNLVAGFELIYYFVIRLGAQVIKHFLKTKVLPKNDQFHKQFKSDQFY